MNRVSTLLSAVPERARRTLRGTPLPVPRDAAGEGRLAYLSQLLNWLTPFNALSPDAQRALGLQTVREKLDRDDEDGEAEEDPLRR